MEQKVTQVVLPRKGQPILRLQHANEPTQQSMLSKIIAAKTIDELDGLLKDVERFFGGASPKTRRRIERTARARRAELLKEFEARKK